MMSAPMPPLRRYADERHERRMSLLIRHTLAMRLSRR